jgi:uncharacterized delta-60 repeat protein
VPTAGLLNPAFGNGGLVTSSVGAAAAAVAVQPDGKIIVGGNGFSIPTPGIGPVAVFRFNANGSVDRNFGNGGFTVLQVGNSDRPGALAAVVQPDGKILLVGSDDDYSPDSGHFYTAFCLVRLTSARMPDASFGAGGVDVTMFPNHQQPANPGASGEAVALAPGGKVVVVGDNSGGGGRIALARYQTFDNSAATVRSHTSLLAAPFIVGGPAILTAIVTAPGSKPTGTVTFLDGKTIIGAAFVGPDGKAICNPPTLGAGKRQITALYSGDAHDRPSSAAGGVVVSPAKTTLSMWADPLLVGLQPAPTIATVTAGSPVPLTVTIGSPSITALLPAGSVTFLDGNKVVGTVVLPSQLKAPDAPDQQVTVTLTLAKLAAGSHVIKARYSGDGNFVASTAALTVLATSP